jgi:hypothetical protein
MWANVEDDGGQEQRDYSVPTPLQFALVSIDSISLYMLCACARRQSPRELACKNEVNANT